MKIVLYYFSGTGNSYRVARDIAESIQAELLPIAARVDSDKVVLSADYVGIVFPDYYSSIPHSPQIPDQDRYL